MGGLLRLNRRDHISWRVPYTAIYLFPILTLTNLKLLIIKSVLILVPFFSLVGLVELRLRYVPNEYSSTKAALDSKVGEVEILITGTSHAHDGVAAQFLSRPAFNLGKGSQSLYYDTQLVSKSVSYTHLRAHETPEHLVC